MTDRLTEAIRTVARDLMRSHGVGGHVHFDDPVFRELVPDFRDVAWIPLASSIATVLSAAGPSFLVKVPLCWWTNPPAVFTLESLTTLEPSTPDDPREPPAIHILTKGSAYDHRTRRTGWYSDAVPQVPGSVGWLYAQFDDDEGRPFPIWRVSLTYETR